MYVYFQVSQNKPKMKCFVTGEGTNEEHVPRAVKTAETGRSIARKRSAALAATSAATSEGTSEFDREEDRFYVFKKRQR